MKFYFHPEAEKEFMYSVDYYEEIESGLGYEFAIEAYSAINRAIEFPNAWSIIGDSIRRSLVKRFPFGKLYSIEQNSLLILAVMNLHQEPNYWKERV
jgi:hypothetical protein